MKLYNQDEGRMNPEGKEGSRQSGLDHTRSPQIAAPGGLRLLAPPRRPTLEYLVTSCH